ncbi:MAG TPA: transcriptional repressor [Deltaproteobacteria bacterium]|jgi:Fur family peroxide stress response transcriptional regulator|nr:transcriptional repressor [Deltaproteobacteria bacterium]OQC29074.1 MAG: Peroxide operon regulator [Deltaproteobacteria bacterium ADurb.Bin072]HRW80032.1 transcriptional repressor [Desulfomonilia bacterium]HNQ85885.1 transcriptional repressor [Deltaproteobacteria bacterium]HNS90155.1 transcriptional repressor [Deltaproteobacteria bacterium]
MKNPSVKHRDQVARRLEQMLSSLRERSFRLTPQRMAVLEILASSQGHPTVAEIYESVRARFPTTSLATVYKTVILLKELGEVLELGFPDGSNRYDGSRPYPHPHIVCTRCRKIMDPELSSIDHLNEEIAEKTGYTIEHHRLDFFGLCPACQARA